MIIVLFFYVIFDSSKIKLWFLLDTRQFSLNMETKKIQIYYLILRYLEVLFRGSISF